MTIFKSVAIAAFALALAMPVVSGSARTAAGEANRDQNQASIASVPGYQLAAGEAGADRIT